jgi:hypothetical protein
MKKLKLLQLLLLCSVLIYTISDAAAPARIVGASVEGPIPPSTGICSGTITMTDGGTLTLPDTTTIVQMGIGSAEGFGYADTEFVATFTTNQHKINLSTFAIDSSAVINTGNNPDASGTLKASHYNTENGGWVVIGRCFTFPTPPCTDSFIHFRKYIGGTLTTDVMTAITTNSGSEFGPTFDSTFTYILYTSGGIQQIGKFNSSTFAFLDFADVSPGSGSSTGLTNDTSFVYASAPATFRILRYDKSNFATVVGFTPGFAGSIQQPTFDNGNLYVPSQGSGVTANIVYRQSTSNLNVITDQVNLGASEFVGKVLVDSVNNKLYVAVNSGSTQVEVVRLNRTTLAVEQTFSGIFGANGVNLPYSSIDVVHQKIYMVLNGDGGAAKIQRISMCS